MEPATQTKTTETTGPDLRTLIRDAGVLQIKLVFDGLRDLVLVPASMVAALVSLARAHDGIAGPQFYRLLKLGKRSEQWIDLFAAHRNLPDENGAGNAPADTNIDDIVKRMESFVVEEYRRGGVTAQAKNRIDAALTALQRKQKPGR